MTLIVRMSLAAACLCLPLLATAARADDDHHCPTATADNSSRFFSKDADSSAHKKHVAALAQQILAEKDTVCLVALMDPTGAAYSKKLAIGRVNWLRESLTKAGVPLAQIGYELRPAATTNDPDIPSVLAVLGH